MNLKVGLIINSEQLEVLSFENEQNLGTKIIDLEDINNSLINVLLFSSNEKNDDMMPILVDNHKYMPVRAIEDFRITKENFFTITKDKALEIFNKSIENWTLQNNLELLEKLFPTLDHLKALWPNDRTAFMEELWFILKNNLGSFELKLIYNSLKRGEKENEKNKLIQCRITGSRLPETFEGDDFDRQVMDHYKSQFSDQLEISEFSTLKNELVATVSLKGSPVLIMAKVNAISKLQQSLLTALMDGLGR